MDENKPRFTVIDKTMEIERVQTGVRIEKSMLKVLKALAEYHDITLGDLMEGIVLHVFEGKLPFGSETMAKITELKKVYQMNYGSELSHKLHEKSNP